MIWNASVISGLLGRPCCTSQCASSDAFILPRRRSAANNNCSCGSDVSSTTTNSSSSFSSSPSLPVDRMHKTMRLAVVALLFLIRIESIQSFSPLSYGCAPSLARTVSIGYDDDEATSTWYNRNPRRDVSFANRVGSCLNAIPPVGGKRGGGFSDREMEIRRKIAALKQEGRLGKRHGGNLNNGNKQQDPNEESLLDDVDDDDEREVQEAIASMIGDDGDSNGGIVSSSKSASQKEADAIYESRIREKLGNAKSQHLWSQRDSGGSSTSSKKTPTPTIAATTSNDRRTGDTGSMTRPPKIGALEQPPPTILQEGASNSDGGVGVDPIQIPIINPDLVDDSTSTTSSLGVDDDGSDDEQALVDLVEQKLLEKRERERKEETARIQQQARAKLEQLENERRELQQQKLQQQQQQQGEEEQTPRKQLTTGVGGSWEPPRQEEEKELEYYQPKTGSWGAFPRPKDISQAYGGGRRIGPGFSSEAERLKSEEETRARLQQYREKVGIDVPSEREHASEIDEALRIASYAMQRGRYSTGVSALEKVTKYCSTNSKVGGKVFLELAMAYEAVGQTAEAITVYRTLTNSRIEEIKFNAKRLLYGIEAMQFMRDDVKSPEFSRRKVRNTFIDTTGFGNIASHFDDVYQTAYVDLEGGFYKKLTESVVRSSREARQVLLRATNAGEVGRLRVVQALRSISRSFDDALEREIRNNAPVSEPVAVMNGVPIRAVAESSGTTATATAPASITSSPSASQDFVLTDAESMMANLDGEWKLQLLADKRGDGVKYFNSSLSWQTVNVANMTFSSCGPAGFSSIQQSGSIEFNDKRRILRRRGVQGAAGGGVVGGVGGLLFSGLLLGGPTKSGFASAVLNPQQIMSVDSVLLITRGIPNRRVRQGDDDKDYFAVWRRVERGTCSEINKGMMR